MVQTLRANALARVKEDLASTCSTVVTRYATRLRAVGSVLFLAGASPRVVEQRERAGALRIIRGDRAIGGTQMLTESTREARRPAQQWLAQSSGGSPE